MGRRSRSARRRGGPPRADAQAATPQQAIPGAAAREPGAPDARGAERLVELGLLAFVALAPLIYVPGLVNLYRLPKQAFLSLLAAVVLWGVAFRALRGSGTPVLPLFWPVVAYVLVTLVSLSQAVNLYRGLVHSAHTIVTLGFFWLAAACLTRQTAVLRLFHWASLSAALVSVLGIAQVWGLTIPTLVLTDGGSGATFGNVSMVAQYLLLVLPAAYALVFLADPGPAQWLRALAAALPTTYLAYTGSRAAWAGLAIAVLVFALLLVVKRVRLELPWRATAPALAGVLAFVLAMTMLPTLLVPKFGASRYSPIARLGTIAGADQETGARFRVAATANTLAMFRDHPVLGVGKGHLELLYPLYARAVFVDPVYNARTRVNEAHNDWAQLLAETGLVGFAAFAWILLGLSRRFLAGLSPGGDPIPRLLALASAFALVSLLGDAAFDFPFELPVSSAVFWIFAGVLWRLGDVRGPETSAPRWPPRTAAVAVGLLALVATAAAAWGLHALRADYHFSRGLRAAQAARRADAESELREAVRLNPFNDRYWFYLGVHHLRTRQYEAAAHDSLRVLALNPHHIGSLINLGVAYLSMRKLPEAVEPLERAVKIWPDQREARINLARVYARLGRTDLAAAQLREALRLGPADQKAREPAEPLPQTDLP